MMQTGKVLLGILLGAVVGTVLGVLMAPSDERKSRIRTSRESSERYDDAGEPFGVFAIL
jgi:gas vesicle protein